MMPGILHVNKHKKKKNIKLNFWNNKLNRTNLTGKLCKIGNNKIIHTIEIFFKNLLICESISNLHNDFIGEAF